MLRLAAINAKSARRLANRAIAEVRRIEFKYSRYRPDSILSRINAAAGKDWIPVDAETSSLFDYADSTFAASGGLFDISSGVLRRAWDFRRGVVPTDDTLKPLIDLIGWQRVLRDGDRIRLPLPGMELDLGGYGKEYAADRAATLLLDAGVRHGLVNLGGDIRILGPLPDGSAWSIGIQDPRDTGRIIASIKVDQGALATSGDYEKYFELDGSRYCHILDPRSGRPVSYWRSISVLAPLAIVAGSHCSIAMLMQRAGREYLASGDFPFLAIDDQGQVLRKDL